MKVQETMISAYETIYNNLPSGNKMVKTALTMATSAVALEALASLTGADAGPITYGLCVAACTASAPPALPACLAACAISLGPWCP